MKCDICGQDVENSEDLKQHKEQAHPTGVGAKSMDSQEKERPDLSEENPEESAANEPTKATH
jgi:hypothetical protein